MDFKEKLTEYIERLDCTAKDLSEVCGLSAATISRYRSGERIPRADSENYLKLVRGIACIAEMKAVPDITEGSVSASLSPLTGSCTVDMGRLQTNLDTLLDILPVSVSELSRSLNYDASYISRIRNGQRQPADPHGFASYIADFIARRYRDDCQLSLIAALIGCDPDELKDVDTCRGLIFRWLISGEGDPGDPVTDFLEKLEQFDLDEYIRAIHFDELKIPSVPFQLPGSRSYSGLGEMMDSELAFLKATVLSRSREPVIMYSDMPMGEMARDPDFPKKWMFGMAAMLKKGLHLHQIHNIDRSFEDMMLGLESWIPMYMTGQISPYYLRGVQGNVFSHLLKVSGSAALTGEAINGYHSEGRYYLTKNKEEVAYYRKRAEHLLSKASPLMEIYRSDRASAYSSFIHKDAGETGERHHILSSLSLHTLTDELVDRILSHSGDVPASEHLKIREYIASQRDIADRILQHSCITEEIPVMSREEFERHPLALSLSGMFMENDILYTWEDYRDHLELIHGYSLTHPGYTAVRNPSSAFRNIQIYINRGKWVMVSKNRTPVIHFLIRHPKMRAAFENMVIPVVDDIRL